MYRVTFSRVAHKQFKKLPMVQHGKIFNAIGKLMSNPINPALDITKLTDRSGFRLRIGLNTFIKKIVKCLQI